MASRYPVNQVFSVTVKVSQEGLNLRAVAPLIPGFIIIEPSGALKADIEPVLTEIISHAMLQAVEVTLTHEVPCEIPGSILLLFDVEILTDQSRALL